MPQEKKFEDYSLKEVKDICDTNGMRDMCEGCPFMIKDERHTFACVFAGEYPDTWASVVAKLNKTKIL